jgi:hypothetical protein
MRMDVVSQLLHAATGDLIAQAVAQHRTPSGDVVGHGVYLQVLGRVFELLDSFSATLPVDDLVRLSKIVAEQRRAAASAARASGSRPSARRTSACKAADPKAFSALIEELYGVSAETAADRRLLEDQRPAKDDGK